MTTGVVTMDAIGTDPTWKDGPLFPEMSRGPSSWTAERVTELQQWTCSGLSAAEIADKMGVSRNSIIGKWHRLGMSSPVKERKSKPKPRALHWTGFSKRKSPDRKPPMIADGHQSPKVECVPLNIRFLDTTDSQCKYIIGDANGADTICCGLPSEEGKPYCSVHFDACHTSRARGLGTRPDYTYNLRKSLSPKTILHSETIDPASPEQLPDVA